MTKKKAGKKKSGKSKITENEFKRSVDLFSRKINSISFAEPIIARSIDVESAVFSKQFTSFLKRNTKQQKDGKKFSLKLKVESLGDFEKILKKMSYIRQIKDSVPQSLFILLVSYLDGHFKNLLKIILTKQPKLISNTEKNISISELFEISDFLEMKSYVMDREIDAILDSRAKFFDWLTNKLGIKINIDQQLISSITEIVERRNLFVHSNGIVDKRYLDGCKKVGLKDSLPKLKEKLTIDANYFKNAVSSIHVLGVQISHLIWQKIDALDKKSLNSSNETIIDVVVELIDNKRYINALSLIDFIEVTTPAPYDHEVHIVNCINKALTLKKLERTEEMNLVIQGRNWDIMDDKYKISIAVIKGNFEEAGIIMKRIGKDGYMKASYNDWPIFSEFRKSKIFAKTYKKIYGAPDVKSLKKK